MKDQEREWHEAQKDDADAVQPMQTQAQLEIEDTQCFSYTWKGTAVYESDNMLDSHY